MNVEKTILTVIICTYNRSSLLARCLESICAVSFDSQIIEILVIDNNSTDETKEIVSSFSRKLSAIRYEFESKTGLSNARNKGYLEALSDWVLYIDDDALLFQDTIDRALYLIDLNSFDCVGGMYFGYFDIPKPRWIDQKHGTKKHFSDELSECSFDVPHGGIVLYRKSKLQELNGFSNKFGMSGNDIAYGEEVEFQKRLFENGGKIGFDPHLKIWHLVKASRLTVKSILRASYALGKGHKFRSGLSLSKRILKIIVSTGALLFLRIPKSLYKLITDSNYFWQNAIIESLAPLLYHLGRL